MYDLDDVEKDDDLKDELPEFMKKDDEPDDDVPGGTTPEDDQ
jgi:hypothetical protein